jgi:hypothetical protein
MTNGVLFRRASALILLLHVPVFAMTKDSYIKKANQELQVWNAKVDELQKRSEKAGAWTREELERALRTVRHNLGIFQQKVTDVQGSGESGWTTLRKNADEAFRDVKHAYREATSDLKKDKHKEKP